MPQSSSWVTIPTSNTQAHAVSFNLNKFSFCISRSEQTPSFSSLSKWEILPTKWNPTLQDSPSYLPISISCFPCFYLALSLSYYLNWWHMPSWFCRPCSVFNTVCIILSTPKIISQSLTKHLYFHLALTDHLYQPLLSSCMKKKFYPCNQRKQSRTDNGGLFVYFGYRYPFCTLTWQASFVRKFYQKF